MKMTDYQKFIATSRYARWIEEEKRRETWEETVDRFMTNIVSPKLKDKGVYDEIHAAIHDLEIMPSMRAMMTAGPAAARDNTCLYNCAYTAVDKPKRFSQAMFILLCGTGVGFSVERQSVQQLPAVPETLLSKGVFRVEDSKEGWANALNHLITSLYDGSIPEFDYQDVRPAGSRLKTFGGRASGPGPLKDLFNYTINIFRQAKGRKLSSIECHDIMCKIGEVVVVGGVRRSAMISLSNLSDDRMRTAKSGNWWDTNGQRALANNSTAYSDKPPIEIFMREWLSLVESKSGERGIFSRVASQRQAAKNGRRNLYNSTGVYWDYGTNPCSEIILRPQQFCNLSEVVVRQEDTVEDLALKVQLATILGTIQSTYTDFPFLGEDWVTNTEEERLLGVSLTGIMDNTLTNGREGNLEELLDKLKQVAIDTNREWAETLGIPVSAAITCVKPSGTVSQLVDSASGIHARHSPYYIRTVRGDNKDPLTQFMKEMGIPYELCVSKPEQTTVFSFPQKAPEGAITRNEMTAIEQLELWRTYQTHWCEHKPSVTISVREEEWLDVGAWVYRHFDEISGVSFLPHTDHTYQQAPYQDCTEEEYTEMLSRMPKEIDWHSLADYETEDTSKGTSTFACSGDSCEIVDIGQ